MALVNADRVRETSTTTGTGTYDLAGAVAGHRTFVAGIGTGNTCWYCATDGTDWEVGIGTVTDATPDTLARTTIIASSNAGAAVNWSAGTRQIFCTLPASRVAPFTPASASGPASIDFAEDTDNGAHKITVTAPASVASDKTITLPDATDTLVGKATTDTLTNKTLTDPAIIGTILEDVYTITDGAGFEIDPGNGSIQLITLGASRTPAATNFAAGESVTLMVADGTAYTITWSTVGVVWVGGSAPTLATSGYTVIELWKVGSTIYGARVGDVA